MKVYLKQGVDPNKLRDFGFIPSEEAQDLTDEWESYIDDCSGREWSPGDWHAFYKDGWYVAAYENLPYVQMVFEEHGSRHILWVGQNTDTYHMDDNHAEFIMETFLRLYEAGLVEVERQEAPACASATDSATDS